MIILSKEKYKELKKNNKEGWLKYCYELCDYYKWEKYQILEVAKEYNYANGAPLINNGRKYARDFLNMKEEEIREFKKPYNLNSVNTKYNSVLNKIIKIDNKEEIKKTIEKSGCNLADLLYKVPTFLRIHKKELTDSEKDYYEKELKNKIMPSYIKWKKELKEKNIINRKEKTIQQEKELVPLIEELFIQLINNKVTEKELKSKLNYNTYKKYLRILKTYSNDLYKEYTKKISEDKNTEENMFLELDNIIDELIRKLVNGITTENGTRNFDIIDFYTEYEKYINYTPNYLKRRETVLTNAEIRLLRTFYKKNIEDDKELNNKTREDFINSIYYFDYKKDKNGFPIPNTGKTVGKQEKKYMLVYLKEKNIPITKKTTTAMVNRYKFNMTKINKEEKIRKLIK